MNKKNQDYSFIKETIKQKDKKATRKKLAVAAACGIVFGLCAVFTFMLCMPWIMDMLEKKGQMRETIQFSPPEEGSDQEKEAAQDTSPEKEESDSDTAKEQTENDSAARILEYYRTIQNIAAEPRKALVRVAGMTGDSDLLDDSFLTYGNEEGIVFYKNEQAYFILTTSENFEKLKTFRITFSNGDTAVGSLCGTDKRTKIAVLRVEADMISEATRKEIPAVSLCFEWEETIMQPVIAIGSPTGDMDSLFYGTITSVAGELNIADAEYSMITTDMVSGKDGGGILLNMQGQMVGLIVSNEEDDDFVLRAVATSQIATLLEKLTNGEKICYAGIIGSTVTIEQSRRLDIPQGVYVDRVEQNSPAMTAGIQSGDIIHGFGDQEIATMQEYSRILQHTEPGTRMKVNLYRKNTEEYVDVELNIIVQ